MTRSGIPLPEEFAARARDIIDGRVEPVSARDAATVMLLRPDRDGEGIQVYMLRRKPTMAFAPGVHAFPGGSVDARDADHEVGWAGPTADAWGMLLAVPPEEARALVCAAVRETFEESGVLLAGPIADTAVADTCGADWEADRRALLDKSHSLAELLDRRGLVVRSDLLRPWARWITPEIETRRFDTRFFTAALPAGQRTRDVGGEADKVAWLRPADALDAARRREIRLMPPTAVALNELDRYRTVSEVLVSERELTPLLPAVSMIDGTPWLTVPAEVEYPL